MTTLADLTHDPKNARKHNPRNIGAIVNALGKVGAARSIVIDENNVILAGNGLVEAAGEAGIEKVQIVDADGETVIAVRRTGLSKKQKAELAILDNRTAELAEWDVPVLNMLADEVGLDLADVEFTTAEVEGMDATADGAGDGSGEVTEDEAPDAADVPKRVSKGDLWQLGDHYLLCGDATSPADVSRLMGKAKAELLFTSPPYSDMREYKDGTDVSVETLSKFIPAFSPYAAYIAFNLGLKRSDGEIVPYWQTYLDAGKAAGLKLLSWNIWNREHCGYSVGAITAMFAIQHEFIFVLGRATKKLNLTVPNKEGGELNTHIGQRQADGSTKKQDDVVIRSHRQLGTVQSIGTQLARHEGIDHPAMMPVALPAAYIEAVTNPGDIVAEPFCGSGTTLIAAEQLGRRCYATELSPEYCDVILARWEKLTGGKAAKA